MTEFIEWTDELSVGIEEIDEQHRVLVDLVNEMHQAITDQRGSEVVSDILEKLADYTRIHFAVEESLMRILQYPDYEPHKEQHEKLIAHLRELRGKVESGQTAIGFELMHFLRNWLTQHILGTDKEYVDHFLNAGIQPATSNPKKRRSWAARLWDHLH